MSFREKSAWISLVSYLGVYGYYFWRVFSAAATGQIEDFHYGSLLVRLIILLVMIQVVLTILVAVWAPRDANTPKDERDRLIDLKAGSIGYGVIMAGALAVVVAIQFGADAFYTANGLFLAVIAAEVFKNVGQIVQYRMSA